MNVVESGENSSFIEEMQHFSQLSEAERNALTQLQPWLEEIAPALAEAFYENLLSHAGTARHFESKPELVAALKKHLQKWFIGLANGNYSEIYAENRYQIGYRHVAVGLEMKYMVAAMSFCRNYCLPRLREKFGESAEATLATLALDKVMDLDLNLMLKSYVERSKEELTKAEQESLRKFLSVTGMSEELYKTLLRAAE